MVRERVRDGPDIRVHGSPGLTLGTRAGKTAAHEERRRRGAHPGVLALPLSATSTVNRYIAKSPAPPGSSDSHGQGGSGRSTAQAQNPPSPRDRLEARQEPREAFPAERTVEEEDGACGQARPAAVLELRRVALDDRDPGRSHPHGEVARGPCQVRLDLDADGARARQQANDRDRAPHARTDVHERVRRGHRGALDDAKEDVHRGGQVRDAVPRQLGTVVRQLVEPEHAVHPRVPIDGRHGQQRLAK